MLRKLPIILGLILVLFTAFPSGCGTSGSVTEDMMKVLPADTDLFFVFDYDKISQVTALEELWDDMIGGLLPDGAAPSVMGMSARSGVLSSLIFTFPGGTSYDDMFPAETYPNRYNVNDTEITHLGNGLDFFEYQDMLVFVMMDEGEAFLTEANDKNSSMYTSEVYRPVVDASLEGSMVLILQSASVTGLPAMIGVSVDKGKDSTDFLTVSGIIDYGDEDKANAVVNTIDDYLSNIWSLQGVKTELESSFYSLEANLDVSSINDFLEGVMRDM
jgi:hypothetical protein